MRELEIRADQTFDVFFHTITANLKVDQEMPSSFYTCDHRYRKRLEICYIDINDAPAQDGGNKTLIMKDCRINEFVDDPHQKFILVYDFINQWTFYIELIKIFPANQQHSYPRFSRSEGDTPRELVPVTPDIPDEDILPEFTFEEDVYDPEDMEAFEVDADFVPEEDNNFDGFDEEKAL